MANEEHLAILRQGVEVWNQWRRDNLRTMLDLRLAELPLAKLSYIDFRRTILDGANLYGANLYGASAREVNLSLASLEGASLSRADFTQTNFQSANLQHANFIGTKLKGSSFAEMKAGWTTFDDLDLSSVANLDTVNHLGPSTVGIDTLYRSHGQIPEVFLRGCGVPARMIEYARSLTVTERPIDYYSVFISYTSNDEAVAKRLHADLQAEGVRSWFAPHNMEIGEVIVRGIDDAIQVSDKLLIILSEASVKSHWVEFEVNQALHREVGQGRSILYPIRLDDTVLHVSSGWAAQLCTRNIGDFRGWKDHDVYQRAFKRLLQDLQAKG